MKLFRGFDQVCSTEVFLRRDLNEAETEWLDHELYRSSRVKFPVHVPRLCA